MGSDMTVSVLRALDLLLEIITYIIIIRSLVSWLPVPKDNTFIRLLYQLTEPILSPIRNMVEKTSFGKNLMIDISSVIAILIIILIKSIISSMI